MQTLRKISLVVGDSESAARVAKYPLERGDSPQAQFQSAYHVAADPTLAERPERAHTMWLGSRAALEAIGVERGAEVTADQLARALQGQHVTTGEQVRRPKGKRVPVGAEHGEELAGELGKALGGDAAEAAFTIEQRVANVDSTFSVPKTLSVAHAYASPDEREWIEDMVLRSAYGALEYAFQSKDVIHRQTGDGRRVREPARGVAAALALHVSARRAEDELVPSPQLHVHCIPVGAERNDMPFGAYDARALFAKDVPLEVAAMFRALMVEELVDRGYDVESEAGKDELYFELVGVSQGLAAAMSGRTREVMRAAEAYERRWGEPPTGRALAALAMETRAPKDKDVSPEQVASVRQELSRLFGFGRAEADGLKELGQGYGAKPLEERRAEAKEVFERRMLQSGPTVTVAKARAIAFAASVGRLRVQETVALVRDMEQSGELIALERGRVTTLQIRELEGRVVDVARRAAAEREPALSDAARAAGRAAADARLAPHALDPEQVRAFETLTSGHGWAVLTGRAGTGKGPTLQAVAAAHQADGWQVIACAADNVTAQLMGKQTNAQGYSIARVVSRIERGLLDVDERTQPTLILIDEASKVGLASWAQIADLRERFGVRVIAVGHDGQLGAIESPGMFGQMVREDSGIPVEELTEIRRAKHEWMREFQVALDSKRAREAVEILWREGALVWHATREEALTGTIADWDGRRDPDDPGKSLLITQRSNADVNELNVRAQERRLSAGEIGGPSVTAVDRDYEIYAGDRVILSRTAYRFERTARGDLPRRVENGQVGIVDSVDPERDTMDVVVDEPGFTERLVRIELGPLRDAPPGATTPAWRLAYSGHVHVVQGATVEDALVLGGGRHASTESWYVALSRQTDRLTVHLSVEDYGGPELTEEQLRERLASEMGRSGKGDAAISLGPDPRVRIATELPAMEPVPAFPRHVPGTEVPREAPPVGVREAEADAVREAGGAEREPLADQADVLGRRRAGEIVERAHELSPRLAELDDEAVRAERDAAASAFDRLDRTGARETLALERRREHLVERIEAARAAAERPGENAEVQLKLAADDEARLAVVYAKEEQLYEDGRHLDAWVEQHGEQASRWLAAERELAIRREREGEQAQPFRVEPGVGRPVEPGAEPGVERRGEPGADPPADRGRARDDDDGPELDL